MFGDLKLLGRYAVNLRRHVSHPFSTAECEELLRRGMSTREQSFLRLLETVIFAKPENPYRALLEHAGVEIGDVAALVQAHGLEGALDVLYDAGVYVTHDEYRGRVPVTARQPGARLRRRRNGQPQRAPGARRP